MVVLGDSIAYGMCAAEPENEWNQVVAGLLRKFQDEELTVFNRGLPAGVISPRCPGYEESAKPSLIERYQKHCIDLKPDLVIIAEGVNDMRSGMPLQEYIADLEMIVKDIQLHTDALIVHVGVYYQRYGIGANDPTVYETWTRWSYEISKAYNLAIRLTAEKHGAVFVDAQQIMGETDWVLHVDACHLNDLGHVLIGNGIFQAIVHRCKSLADKTFRNIEAQEISILNTGGTDTDQEIQQYWDAALSRFSEHLDS